MNGQSPFLNSFENVTVNDTIKNAEGRGGGGIALFYRTGMFSRVDVFISKEHLYILFEIQNTKLLVGRFIVTHAYWEWPGFVAYTTKTFIAYSVI